MCWSVVTLFVIIYQHYLKLAFNRNISGMFGIKDDLARCCFNFEEVVDLFKIKRSVFARVLVSGDCLFVSRSWTPPTWIWLFLKLWLLHGLPAKRQLIEASSVSPQWPAWTWRTFLSSIPGRVLLLLSVSHPCLQKLLDVIKYGLFFLLSHMHYFSLSQVNMQRKAIFQLILEKRELLESQRFRRSGNEERLVA